MKLGRLLGCLNSLNVKDRRLTGVRENPCSYRKNFLRCCSPQQVEGKLRQMRPAFIEGLRAVFI